MCHQQWLVLLKQAGRAEDGRLSLDHASTTRLVWAWLMDSVKNITIFVRAIYNSEYNYGHLAFGSMPHHLIVGLLNKLTGRTPSTFPTAAPPRHPGPAGARSRPCRRRGRLPALPQERQLRILAIRPEPQPFRAGCPPPAAGFPITVRGSGTAYPLPGKANAGGSARRRHLQPALAQPDLISSMAQVGMEVQSSHTPGAG